jgi:type I restriction enzyme R subunit
MKERDREGFLDADRADILLVVNMFLTGFDAKKLNTLYVDKNLRYHGLIQAFSRTNRILGELKSQGNIVCFRNLKDKTDEAISLYSDENANESVLLEPYEHYVERFNIGVCALKAISETPDAVNDLYSEDDQLKFVQAFRGLIRELNVLSSFTEFSFKDLDLPEQQFEDFKSKYLDIHDHFKNGGGDEGTSIINDVDFELELIQRDEINVAYILKLLAKLKETETKKGKGKAYEKQKKQVLDTLSQEVQLRSKRELIERFIEKNMTALRPEDDVTEAFSSYWSAEKDASLDALSQQERMNRATIERLLNNYQFSGKEPLREEVFAALETKPKLIERKTVFERIVGKLMEIVQVFEDDMGAV